jgi:hypothetical protein
MLDLQVQELFKQFGTEDSQICVDPCAKGIDGVPIELMQLRGLNESSTRENIPYFTVVHGLSHLLKMRNSEVSQDRVVMVAGVGTHVCRFWNLFRNKDPVAFLLLWFWYTRACRDRRWMRLRSKHDLPAICIDLQRHHLIEQRHLGTHTLRERNCRHGIDTALNDNVTQVSRHT